jgi:ATP-dependent helicase/DNAse subunit B
MADKYNDKYSAVWVSHSSMGDFLKCPRCYFLHNVYKNPKTRRKISIVSPALALGSAVHETLESLAEVSAEKRQEFFKRNASGKPEKLLEKFEKAWSAVSGKKGGFAPVIAPISATGVSDLTEEAGHKARGVSMLERVAAHPEPLIEKTIRFGGAKMDAGGMLPNFFLSETDNIILCGKLDWLIYRPADDSVHILDFKTGKNEETADSLQLPIYLLLLDRLQKRTVSGASYWYLDRDDKPFEVSLPTVTESFDRVIEVARQVKKARDIYAAQVVTQKKDGKSAAEPFLCPQGIAGCFACKPFEKIVRGEAEYVGVGEYNQDLYIV